MRIQVVGSGGREHALCWALRRENPAAVISCTPGNAGTALVATNHPIGVDQIDALVDEAVRARADLVVIGPEAPLAAGLADRLRARRVPTFGPSQGAAAIEASKAFAKDVMAAAGVPTAPSRTFTDLTTALRYIDRHPEPLVVKASGLAAGKGAIVCATRAEARSAAQAMLGSTSFGAAGETIVVEAFLEGEELSVLALTNGEAVEFLPAAQDHKRLLAGDLGPNTGGMGAYSPVSLASPVLLDTIRWRVFDPVLAELARRGTPFSGVLYAGLMISPTGEPWVIEFNCRLGDPETEVILPRLAGGLTEALVACAANATIPPLPTIPDAAVTTVLAARGYPDQPERGAAITIPDSLSDDVMVFHAGTARGDDGVVRATGGRVLAVTGLGGTFEQAQSASRAAAEAIRFDGKQFRDDIGWREARRA